MEAVDLARARHELEQQISRIQAALEEASLEQERMAGSQQELNQESEAEADRQNLHRSEIQSQLSALEPERLARMKGLDAEEANFTVQLQKIGRDGDLPPESRQYREDERRVVIEGIRSKLEEIPAKRAEVEQDSSRRASELQAEMSNLEMEAAERNAEVNRRNREYQQRAAAVTGHVNALQRELERSREDLNTLIAEEKAAETSSEAERIATQKARQVEAQLATISEDRDQLEQQLKEMAPLVDAQREATSGQGAGDLAQYYVDSADGHRTSWRWWLVLLIVSIVLSGALGLAVVEAVEPGKNPKPAEVFHSVAVALLVVGLLLYLVRITSLQFRVHRNLEAVDRSKAAALRTYNRIVAGASPEARGTLVATLAEAVFRTPDTGFVGDSSDHVTLIERVVSQGVNRSS